MTDYGSSSLILRQNPKTSSKKGNQFEFTAYKGLLLTESVIPPKYVIGRIQWSIREP